jgi:pilus assembly protein Flp/PilA
MMVDGQNKVDRRSNMRSLVKLVNQLRSDETGAALIEYTVLLGILLLAVVAIIGGVGQWVSTEWTSLSTAI